MRTLRPGRLACLERAATNPDLGTAERLQLIRYGAPGWDPEHVSTVLEQVVDARARWQRAEADALMAGLLEPPKEDDHA